MLRRHKASRRPCFRWTRSTWRACSRHTTERNQPGRDPAMDKNEVMQWLERRGTRRTVEGMARYGIVAERAFGVPMGTLLLLRKQLGQDHALSLALWDSGWYEARLLAALVGDPERVTRRQMNAWAA